MLEISGLCGPLGVVGHVERSCQAPISLDVTWDRQNRKNFTDSKMSYHSFAVHRPPAGDELDWMTIYLDAMDTIEEDLQASKHYQASTEP